MIMTIMTMGMDLEVLYWVFQIVFLAAAGTPGSDAACPPGWSQVNDHCYSGVITSGKEWGIARAHCQSYGGDLLVFDSQNDIVAINTTLGIPSAWVGCHDRLTAGEWLCPRQEMTSLVDWAESQPSMQGCVYVDSNRELHVDHCGINKQYICEVPLDQATTDSYANCPLEWMEWNGGCYYYSYQPMSWDLADGYCRDAVSSLVAFQTASERDGVRDLFPGPDVWIGCNNREGISEWSCPGTQDSFLDFGVNPSSAAAADQCLVMTRPGSFRYEGCSGVSYNFVCRMPVGQYQGCFRDENPRTFAVGMLDGAPMNLYYCMVQCNSRNYVFAGLQYASQCFCGNTGYLRVGRVLDWECTMQCNGQSNQYCGNGWKNTVYQVGSKADPVTRKYAMTKGKRLNAGVFKTLGTRSVTACTDACTRNTQCTSFNFRKSSGTCELSHDWKTYLGSMWVDDPDCEYGEITPS